MAIQLEWNNSYGINIKEIDDQHKKLLELINKLSLAIQENQKEEEVIATVLSELVDYSLMHFSVEEKYFDKFNYKLSDAHKKEHRDFILKISEFHAEEFNKSATLANDIIHYLIKWLIDHIMHSDQKYVSCFHENGVR